MENYLPGEYLIVVITDDTKVAQIVNLRNISTAITAVTPGRRFRVLNNGQ